MKYEPARNRGIKILAEMKTRINFKLPEHLNTSNPSAFLLNYSSTNAEKQNSPKPKSQAVYNYTINL
jgi:hypothetical protein